MHRVAILTPDPAEADNATLWPKVLARVQSALDGAGMAVPSPTYRVQLLPAASGSSPAEPPPPPPAKPEETAPSAADLKPSTDLDEQLTQERARKAEDDMLNAPSGPAAK